MFNRTLLSTFAAFLLSFSLLFVGCDSQLGNNDSDTGTMEVRLFDAPIDSADEVNVNILRVEVNREEDDEGWQVISEPDSTFNLLELTNGAYAVLGEQELEAGTYHQIRLILSQDGHNIVVDGEEHDLKVPSGAQTGIKLEVDAEIEPGITYVLLLDFDVSKSVVKAGMNNPALDYLLKPVIRATNQATTGNIAGTVDPAEARPMVHAIDANDDTLASAAADTSNGGFMLMGLDEGTYTVSIDPRNDDYLSKDTTGVSVTVGETNDLGTIELEEQ